MCRHEERAKRADAADGWTSLGGASGRRKQTTAGCRKEKRARQRPAVSVSFRKRAGRRAARVLIARAPAAANGTAASSSRRSRPLFLAHGRRRLRQPDQPLVFAHLPHPEPSLAPSPPNRSIAAHSSETPAFPAHLLRTARRRSWRFLRPLAREQFLATAKTDDIRRNAPCTRNEHIHQQRDHMRGEAPTAASGTSEAH